MKTNSSEKKENKNKIFVAIIIALVIILIAGLITTIIYISKSLKSAEEQDSKITAMDSSLSASDKRIEELETENDELNDANAGLVAQKEALNDTNTALNQQITELTQQNGVLTEANNKFTVTYIVDNAQVGKEIVVKSGNVANIPVAPDGYKYIWNKDGKNITEDTVIIGETYCKVNLSSDEAAIGEGGSMQPFATFDKDTFYVKKGAYIYLDKTGIYNIDYNPTIYSYDTDTKIIDLSANYTQEATPLVNVTCYDDTLQLAWKLDSVSTKITRVTQPIDLSFTVEGCFAKGTKVTMADGTYKNIEDVVPGDKILTYNSFEGKMVEKEVITLLSGIYENAPVYTVTLDNGSVVEIVVYQLVFDMELRKYVPITLDTYELMVGRSIMVNDNGEIGSSKILSITAGVKTVEHYDIYTKESIGYIAGDIVAINYIYLSNNPFAITEEYKVDMDSLISECEEYGYFTYEEFSEVCTLDTFNNFNVKYLKPYVIKNGINLNSFKQCYRLLQTWIDLSLKNYEK